MNNIIMNHGKRRKHEIRKMMFYRIYYLNTIFVSFVVKNLYVGALIDYGKRD